jgi:sulfur-carrier protein
MHLPITTRLRHYYLYKRHGTRGQQRPDPVDVRISDMAKVTIRYWAAAREAAGTSEEEVQASTLADALGAVAASRLPGTALKTVMARSSFLVDGSPAGRRDHASIELADGSVIEVLPPFAGG